jgi:hypothetical protein
MKVLLTGLLFVGAQAFACPDLTGTYTCSYEGQTETLEISQSETDGVTTFTMKDPTDPNDQGGSLPADNNTYQIEDSEQFKNATIRGYCEADAFKIAQAGQYYDQGQHIADIDAVISMSLVDGNLLQDTKGVFKTASGDYPLDSQLTCTRTN